MGPRHAARGRGARATVVHDRPAGRKDCRVVHRAHHLDVLETGDVAESLQPAQTNARSPNCAQTALILASVSGRFPGCCQTRSKSAVFPRQSTSRPDRHAGLHRHRVPHRRDASSCRLHPRQYLAAPAKTQAALQLLHDCVSDHRRQVLIAVFTGGVAQWSPRGAMSSWFLEIVSSLLSAGVDHPDGRRRRSANTPQAGEIFQEIGGGRNAFGGFGHPGGDLAGAGDVLRGEDGAQVRDQRFSGSGSKSAGQCPLSVV